MGKVASKNRNGKTGHCKAVMYDAIARIEDEGAPEEPEYATPEQFR